MKGIYISIVLAAIVGIGIYALNTGDSFDYIVVVDDEVTQLENELAAIDLAVEAGTLTSAQATEAKVKIINRLNTINDSVANAESGKLTPAQRQQLSAGLDKLKTILINYQATLSEVDNKAVEADVEAKVKTRSGGGSSKYSNLNLVIAETIEAVQDTAEDTIDDYESNEELDEQVEDIVDEEEEAEETEVMDDTDETEDEDTEENEDEEMDDETADEPMDDSTTTEATIEAEAEITI